MILSGKEILKRKDTDIIIDPFREEQVNPNSYNLRLHNELMVYDKTPLDMKKIIRHLKLSFQKTGCYLKVENYI